MKQYQNIKTALFITLILSFSSLNIHSATDVNTQTKPVDVVTFEKLGDVEIEYSSSPYLYGRSFDDVSQAVMIDDKVYCLSSERDRYFQKDEKFIPSDWKLWMYDIQCKVWTVEIETEILAKRNHANLFNYNGNVLAYGGWINYSTDNRELKIYKCFNDGCVFDTKTKEIKKLPEEGTPSPRAHYSAVFNGEELIIFGGINENLEILNDGGIFNVKTWKWRKITSEGVFSSLAMQKALWLPENPNWKHSKCMLIWGGTDKIEAIYKKSLSYKDEAGKLIESELVFDHYKIIPKDVIAVYYPETGIWEVIQNMYFENDDGSTSQYYRPGRNGSEIVQVGNYIIEWGGKDEDDKWIYKGRKLDLRTLKIREISKENQPPARIDHKLIPFKETDEDGEICDKILVAFGDMQVINGCETGWYSHTCGVYNIDKNKWEKKLFCPFNGFMTSRHSFCAWDTNRIFYYSSSVILYDIKADIANVLRRFGTNSGIPDYDDLKYFSMWYDRKNKTTVYYFLEKIWYFGRNAQNRIRVVSLEIPDDFDKQKDKLKFKTVGMKQSIAGKWFRMNFEIYNSLFYTVAIDLANIYHTDEAQLPNCKTCGFVLNKKTGEIFDIPVYKNSLARESASVVVTWDDKLYILGGKHETPDYRNEYANVNPDARTEEMPVTNIMQNPKTTCKMPLETRKRLYPDYPYLDDMYIFDLNTKTWTQKYLPKNIKSRKYAGADSYGKWIFVYGGQRDKFHDNIPSTTDLTRIPEDLYELKNGYVYDTENDKFYPFDLESKYVEGFMSPGQEYIVYRSELYLIDHNFNLDDKPKPIAKRYDFESKNWQKIYFPEDKITEDLEIFEVVYSRDGLEFIMYDEECDFIFSVYTLDDKHEIHEDKQFRSAIDKKYGMLKEHDRVGNTPHFIVRGGEIMCKISYAYNAADEDSDDFEWITGTDYFVYTLDKNRYTPVRYFPNFDEIESDLWSDTTKLLMPSFSLLITYDEDRNKNDEDCIGRFSFYRKSSK